MNYVFKPLKWALLISLIAFLGACSTTSAPQGKETAPYYIAKVDIDASATEAQLKAQYGGDIVSFVPEAGFAVLGFGKEEGELTTLATSTNQDAFHATIVTMNGYSSWASGWSAWASGWSAWAGGWSAWAGGFSAWAGGTSSTSMNANKGAWDKINLKEAHAISRKFGEGVKVAVIDTGIDLNHSMFAGKLVSSGQWKDYVDNDNYPMEASSGNGKGHGTAVASIILQVAPNAKILPIRVLDGSGKGDTDDVINAIYWAVQKGAKVINVSLGTYENIVAMKSMVDYAVSQGVYVIASAGNDGNWGATYPANWSIDGRYANANYKLITIGSTTLSDVPSSFSNKSAGLQYFAPGEAIKAAAPGDQQLNATGTSFAAPMFSGAIALAMSETSSNNWDAIGYKLYKSTDGIGWLDGRLNVEQLIRSLPGFSEPQYRIKNVNSGKCLEVYGASTSDGSNVNQWSCHTGTNQRWKLIPEGNNYRIINVNSGKALDVYGISSADGANVSQWTYGGGNNQKWKLVNSDDGSFELKAVHSNKCLDVSAGSTADGANVQQWSCNGRNNQKWTLELAN